MSTSPTGRHRAVEGTRRAVAGRHRDEPRPPDRPGSRRAARPGRRGWGTTRTVLLVAVAATAVVVGPRIPEVVDRGDELVADDTTIASDGVPDEATPDDVAPGSEPSPTSSPAEKRSTSRESARPDGRADATPEGDETVEVPDTGPGTFRVAGLRVQEPAADGELTYTVEVEDGLPFVPAATAERVDAVLADERGWETVAGQPLRRTDAGGDFRILVATPATTDVLCAPLATNGEVSCRNGDLVVLNAKRWATGVPDYDGHLPQYRTYLVNHEVGHRLGYGHVECGGVGTPAPVMQQQTYGLDGCSRNAWP